MKFSKLSQLFLVSTLGLLAAVLLTACQIITIDYVFVADSTSNTTSSPGQIQVFAVDSQSGALRQGAPTVSSGGNGPVAMALTSDFNNLYVANNSSKNVVHFTVASDGTLTSKETLTLSDTPVGLAVNPTGKFLYVLYGSSTGSGSAYLGVYALSNGTLSTTATATVQLALAGYAGDTIVPTGVAVMVNGNAVYATVYDQSAYNPNGTASSTAHSGWVFGFSVGSTGALTATTNSPYQAGIKPFALTTEPNNRFVYVTDWASNQLVGYSIGTTGSLTYMINGPFKTGNQPTAIVVDPRGEYIYVTNALDNALSAYQITLASGSPSAIVNSASSAVYSTDSYPVALAVDPALGRFIYTANYSGDSASGFRLNADTGALVTTQATPYGTSPHPTAIAIVPHGNHSIQAVAP
jgi:6-phosphogluconolactonase (cycloisomerase 2 family)